MEGVIEAATKVQSGFERVRELLVGDPKRVLGDPDLAADADDEARSAVVVVVNTAPGVHEEVLVELLLHVGAPRVDHAKVAVPLCWEAAGSSRRFPAFNGTLEASGSAAGTRVWLRGTYVVPLQPLGQFGDGVAGRRLARQAGAAFLKHTARRIDGEELSRPHLAVWRPGSHPVTLAELLASEERANGQ